MPSSTMIPDASAANSKIADLLHRALLQFDGPQSAAKILAKLPKASRPTAHLAEELLRNEVAAGRLWQYADAKGKSRFWVMSVKDFAKVCLMRPLQGPPQTRSDALKTLPKTTFGELSKFAKEELLDELIQAGQVHEWPTITGAGKKSKTSPPISCQKPKPADFERQAAEKATAQRECLEMLHRALQQFDGPQVTAKILKQLPTASCPETDVAEELLKQEVAAGKLWQYPNVSKKPQFWIQSPLEFARVCLARELQCGPQSEKVILKSVTKQKTLAGVPASAIQAMLNEILQDGEAHVCPPLVGVNQTKNSPRIVSFFKPDPTDYVKDALQKVADTLGASFEDILKATVEFADRELEDIELDKQAPAKSAAATQVSPHASQDERLLEAMRTVNPRVDDGDMVLIADLRQKLEVSMPGLDFDHAVLDAVQRRRFAIHRFDRPNLISEEERAQMVHDGDGNYHNTISLWRN